MGCGGTAPARAFLALMGVLLAPACSSEKVLPPACPPREAAFRVEVTAEDGILPPDTSIAVRYQGNQEERFELPAPSNRNEDVCCRLSTATLSQLPAVECPGEGNVPVAEVRAVHCELWTNGIAEITVRGGDYPDVIETLEAVARDDACGLETRPVRLVLQRADGG
jgi:hypothetical protein